MSERRSGQDSSGTGHRAPQIVAQRPAGDSFDIRVRAKDRAVVNVVGKGDMVVGHVAPQKAAKGRDRWRVLFVGASPAGEQFDRIRADRELRELQQVAELGHLVVAARPAAAVTDLAGLLAERPDLLHLSCHGDGRHLIFEYPDGEPHRIPADRVVAVLRTYRENAGLSLRGIVLQACRSADMAEQFRSVADTVVAWRGDLDDDCAVTFAGRLYRELRDVPSLAAAAKIAALHTTFTTPCAGAAEALVTLLASR